MTKKPIDTMAPPDKIWVCLACGKVSKDKFGGETLSSFGWDVSCMLNSDLFDMDCLVYDEHGRVVAINRKPNEDTP